MFEFKHLPDIVTVLAGEAHVGEFDGDFCWRATGASVEDGKGIAQTGKVWYRGSSPNLYVTLL